jgi:hypothetical protein
MQAGGGNITALVPLTLSVGSAASPSLRFSGDLQSGFYRAAADNPALAVSGVAVCDWNASRLNMGTRVLLPFGTAAAPSVAFTNSTNSGIFAAAVDQLVLATAGTARCSITTTAVNFNLPIQVPAGQATIPSIFFNGLLNGFYAPANGQVAVAVGGANRLDFSATRILASIPIYLSSGSAAAPALAFSSDAASGTYLIGVGQVGLSTAGVLRCNWNSTRMALATPLNTSDGSVSAPSYSFSNEASSGFYRAAAGQLAAGVLGTQIGVFSATGLSLTGNLGVSARTTTNTFDCSAGTSKFATGVNTAPQWQVGAAPSSTNTTGEIRWIRIGNRVFVNGILNWTARPSAAASPVQIVLPFTSTSSANYRGVGTFGVITNFRTLANTEQYICYNLANSNLLVIARTTGTTTTSVAYNNMTNGVAGSLQFSIRMEIPEAF